MGLNQVLAQETLWVGEGRVRQDAVEMPVRPPGQSPSSSGVTKSEGIWAGILALPLPAGMTVSFSGFQLFHL